MVGAPQHNCFVKEVLWFHFYVNGLTNANLMGYFSTTSFKVASFGKRKMN